MTPNLPQTAIPNPSLLRFSRSPVASPQRRAAHGKKMGNAALKQRFVNLLEKHAPLLVKAQQRWRVMVEYRESMDPPQENSAASPDITTSREKPPSPRRICRGFALRGPAGLVRLGRLGPAGTPGAAGAGAERRQRRKLEPERSRFQSITRADTVSFCSFRQFLSGSWWGNRVEQMLI